MAPNNNNKVAVPTRKSPVSAVSEKDLLSKVFCHGKLLEAVNELHVYPDSKTFVDMPLKTSARKVLKAFEEIDSTNKDEVRKFCNTYLKEPGQEMEPCPPGSNYNQACHHFNEVIKDFAYRSFAHDVTAVWSVLTRKVKETVQSSPKSTMIYLPYEFVIPGGRFREPYYWDSYWIVKGLLASNQSLLAYKMLKNQQYLIEKYGLIPNGCRTYYLKRSQPPTFALTVKDFVDSAPEHLQAGLIAEFLPAIEKELKFWEKRRTKTLTINGQQHTAFYFAGGSKTPRPESFREDLETASLVSEAQRPALLQSIAAAAESGWDFSSRWCADKKSLHKMITTRILPVDLNAIVCATYGIAANFCEELADVEGIAPKHEETYLKKAENYSVKQAALANFIDSVLWSEEHGAYFDYWVHTKSLNIEFYASTITPLYLGCGEAMQKAPRLYSYLKDAGVFNFAHGIPTSFNESGQQWDFPNCWPPLVQMMVRALHSTGIDEMMQTSFEIADKWLKQVYAIYKRSGALFEKYNCNEMFGAGHGGEYEVQTGFGWTNGVVLELLSLFGDRLSSVDEARVPISRKTSISTHVTPEERIELFFNDQATFEGVVVAPIESC